MGRDKGPPKGGKGAAAASAATKGGAAPAELSLRQDECPICSRDVAVNEEQHVLGTCGACGGHPYHIDCVQEVRGRLCCSRWWCCSASAVLVRSAFTPLLPAFSPLACLMNAHSRPAYALLL